MAGRPRSEERSESVVLQRGLQTFAELGYDGATVREIARRIGVSHNFIGDRFGSKLAFWRAVVDQACAEARLHIDPEGMDDRELLEHTIRRFYHQAVGQQDLHRLIADESTRESERLEYLYTAYIGPVVELTAGPAARLIEAGRMRPMPTHLLYFAALGPVTGVTQDPLARRLGRAEGTTEEDLHALADQLTDFVLGGLWVAGARDPDQLPA